MAINQHETKNKMIISKLQKNVKKSTLSDFFVIATNKNSLGQLKICDLLKNENT